ncbi:15557_t:CDS:10 [Funneliformis mosseae]|uniref:15557_t:CDS:1 n=1 Tax=Funneliformis mosseae TaxID=27381 RepID=A0A9N8ZNC8_FUNMO|nr:15557_t:CDS:10 [Funneliformis mosseae]
MVEDLDKEYEALLEYDSAEDFSDTDSISDEIVDIEKDTNLFVGKSFQSWDHIAKFMKRYATAKGYGIRIGGGRKINKMINEVIKRRYLCRHTGKAIFKQTIQSNVSSCRVECPWLCHPSAMNVTVQYRIIREKFKTRIYRPDLYNAIDKFHREVTPGEKDTDLLLKRLHDKKIGDSRWMECFATELSTIKRLFDEGENAILKRLFGSSSLSLYELFNALEERYQEENDYCEFEEQMNLSLCYHVTEIEFENARSKENVLDESDRFIDNLFDFLQIHLSSFPEDTSTRWYKNQLQGINISNNEFIIISLNASTSKNYSLPTRFLQPLSFDSNQIGEIRTINDSNKISSIILKKRKFRELFGLGKKIMSDVVEKGNENTYHEVLEFFRSIQQKMLQHRILGNSGGNFNTQNDNKNLEIWNPILRRPKGHPKSKKINSILEEPNTKTYRCKLCKQSDHNSKTCKGKENQVV